MTNVCWLYIKPNIFVIDTKTLNMYFAYNTLALLLPITFVNLSHQRTTMVEWGQINSNDCCNSNAVFRIPQHPCIYNVIPIQSVFFLEKTLSAHLTSRIQFGHLFPYFPPFTALLSMRIMYHIEIGKQKSASMNQTWNKCKLPFVAFVRDKEVLCLHRAEVALRCFLTCVCVFFR